MDSTEIAAAMAGLGTLSEVSRRLADVGAVWGFPNHAIGPLPTADRPVEDAPFMVENWPTDWVRTYVAEGFAAFDPVPRAAETLSVPMTISEIRQGAAGFRPDPRAERIFALSDRLGMTCGLLIPVFGPQNYRAMICFAGPGPDPDPPTIAALRLVGLCAHDRIRELSRELRRQAIALSARERDILVAAGQGRSDSDIALAFGITVRTVRFHFATIRRKLGAANRVQALAMAANLGLLGK